MILKKLVEIAGQSSNASPNIFLFIYPFTLREKDINYFCHVYSDFLLDLAEENICNFFIAITKSAISKEIICLISKISQMLRNEDEYFKLRIIYEKFILPILIRRAKACNKVEDAVYEISSFFVLGFLKHCDIGEVGLECVLKNIGKIKDEKIKRKWVELCSIICVRYLEAKPVIVDSLKKQLDGAIELNPTAFKEVLDDPEIVWEVTLRSGRKHKKYPKVPSNLKGIENSSNGKFYHDYRMLHNINCSRTTQNQTSRRATDQVQGWDKRKVSTPGWDENSLPINLRKEKGWPYKSILPKKKRPRAIQLESAPRRCPSVHHLAVRFDRKRAEKNPLFIRCIQEAIRAKNKEHHPMRKLQATGLKLRELLYIHHPTYIDPEQRHPGLPSGVHVW